MKKIISLFVFCVLLACALLPMNVSAEGVILFSDDFESGMIDPNIWISKEAGTAYEIEHGGPTNSTFLQDWAGFHPLQSAYGETATVVRTYGADIAFKCDAWIYDDGGYDASTHSLSLWWADYLSEDGSEGRIVYTVSIIYEDRVLQLGATGEGDGGLAYYPEPTILAEWALPDSEPLVMDYPNPTLFNIGMRVKGAQIDGFWNDQKVVSATVPHVTEYKSPILLCNSGTWCGLDNFIAATADYNLFNESEAQDTTPGDTGATTPSGSNDPSGENNNPTAPSDTAATGGNNAAENNNAGNSANNGANAADTKVESVVETKVETSVVVVGTDAEGNAITEVVSEIVSEIVTRPVANTNSANPNAGNGGSQTGDMTAIVIAVMITALGSAVIVKKVCSK